MKAASSEREENGNAKTFVIMNETEKFEDFLDKMKGLLDNAKKQGHIIIRVEDIENTFPELKETSMRESLIKAFGTIGRAKWGGLEVRDILAWLEKQGEQDPCLNCTNDKGCITCENGELKETTPTKMLTADEVIEWLECKAFQSWAEDINIKRIVDKFKKDFGL